MYNLLTGKRLQSVRLNFVWERKNIIFAQYIIKQLMAVILHRIRVRNGCSFIFFFLNSYKLILEVLNLQQFNLQLKWFVFSKKKKIIRIFVQNVHRYFKYVLLVYYYFYTYIYIYTTIIILFLMIFFFFSQVLSLYYTKVYYTIYIPTNLRTCVHILYGVLK